MFTLRCTALVVIAAATTLLAEPSRSQVWPQRVVRIILPLPAGGGSDLAARLFSNRLSQRWKQPVIVENHPGADGLVGVTLFDNSRDVDTPLFSFAGPISINPLIHEKLPYDPARDLVPIDNIFAIAASNCLGVDSIDVFVARALKEPGKINWTATAGLPQYIFAALQKYKALDMTYVPYCDFALALQDLGECRAHTLATSVPVLLPEVQRGKAKLLLITSRERSPLAEDVPAAREAGYCELLFEGVVGFYGWRDIPSDLKERIAADVGAVATDNAMIVQLRSIGIVVGTENAADSTADIEDQRAKVAAIVQGVKPAN